MQGPLLVGSTVRIVPHGLAPDTEALFDTVSDRRVTAAGAGSVVTVVLGRGEPSV